MPRQATGTVDERRWQDGRTITYRLRVPWKGRRIPVRLGTNHEGWSRERAEVELERAMGQIERGTWRPPALSEPESTRPELVTFHVFASEWWAEKQATIDANTRADYLWRLERYLVPFFKEDLIAELDVRRVDAFRRQLVADREAAREAEILGKPILEERRIRRGPRTDQTYKARKKPLSNRSINMLVDLLAQILEEAVEHKMLASNPAVGRRRRLAVDPSPRTFLEADEVISLLNAAGELDAQARADRRIGRRPALAELCLAGPRISELCDRRWRYVDVGYGRFVIPDSKTPAGVREVEMPLFLVDELVAHRQAMDTLARACGPNSYVYGTVHGGRRDPNRFRDRILKRTAELANTRRREAGLNPLPDRVTPHTLRRTYITLALSAGRDPRFVMAQVGHADPKLTLRLYAQVQKRQRQNQALIWELMRFAGEPERPDDSLEASAQAATTAAKRTVNGTTQSEGAKEKPEPLGRK